MGFILYVSLFVQNLFFVLEMFLVGFLCEVVACLGFYNTEAIFIITFLFCHVCSITSDCSMF